MSTDDQDGVSLDQLITALSRLTTNGERPPSPREENVIAHFNDLRAFLGRDNDRIPFELVLDDGGYGSAGAPPTPTRRAAPPDGSKK